MRRQNSLKPGSKIEDVVIMYPMVQRRIIPYIAASFSFHFVGKVLGALFADYRTDVLQGSIDLLADYHPTIASLKSYITTVAGEGMEECRKVLGG